MRKRKAWEEKKFCCTALQAVPLSQKSCYKVYSFLNNNKNIAEILEWENLMESLSVDRAGGNIKVGA